MWRDTGEVLCENEGGDWRNTSIKQGKPKIAANHKRLGEKQAIDSWFVLFLI